MGKPEIRHSAAVTLSARWLMNGALRKRFAISIWCILRQEPQLDSEINR